jgi:hypothetical protein
MFEAELSCTDCHNLAAGEQNLTTIKQTCVDCHDQDYGDLLIDWERSLEEMDITLTLLLDSVESKLKTASLNKEQKEAYMEEFQLLSKEYKVVRNGRALHNYLAATDMYEVITKKLEEMKEKLERQQR